MSYFSREHANEFVHFLSRQSGSMGRANLAELRRAAADPLHDFRDIRILGDHLSDVDFIFDAQRLTAALFALFATKHWSSNNQLKLPRFAEDERRQSMGASLRKLRSQLKGGEESLDKRFSALLDTPREDLAVPLRGIIQRIATADRPIPINFQRLLTHLVYWDQDDTRLTWAKDYWQATTSIDDPTNEAIASDESIN